jgi:hypothetical protein
MTQGHAPDFNAAVMTASVCSTLDAHPLMTARNSSFILQAHTFARDRSM